MLRATLLALTLLAPGWASACLAPGDEGGALSATGRELYVPVRLLVSAGGETRLPCVDTAPPGAAEVETWFTGPDPTAAFELQAMGPHFIAVRGFSECPVRMFVQSATGQWTVGRAPQVPVETGYGQEVIVWAPGDGLLRVWLGTETGASCPAEIEIESYDH